jgi:ankyrin repeat protein
MLPSNSDLEGNTALHYAIRMERIEFMCYMIEGEYHSYEYLTDANFKPDLSKLNATITNINTSKSYMMGT